MRNIFVHNFCLYESQIFAKLFHVIIFFKDDLHCDMIFKNFLDEVNEILNYIESGISYKKNIKSIKYKRQMLLIFLTLKNTYFK